MSCACIAGLFTLPYPSVWSLQLSSECCNLANCFCFATSCCFHDNGKLGHFLPRSPWMVCVVVCVFTACTGGCCARKSRRGAKGNGTIQRRVIKLWAFSSSCKETKVLSLCIARRRLWALTNLWRVNITSRAAELFSASRTHYGRNPKFATRECEKRL